MGEGSKLASAMTSFLNYGSRAQNPEVIGNNYPDKQFAIVSSF
jgi:hypothetical protein